MKNMISFNLTNQEVALIKDFEELNYGTALNVQSHEEKRDNTRAITPRTVGFIKELRDLKQFHKVEIHDGEPVAATRVCSGTHSGIKFIHKLRFN